MKRTVADAREHDFSVVDADAHYIESIPNLIEYLDEPWRTRLEKSKPGSQGLIFPSTTGDRTVFGRVRRDVPYLYGTNNEPGDVPEIMDYLGVEKSIQLSHMLLSFARIEADDDRATFFSNAYVDYMLDVVVDPDEGIYTCAVVPYQDPDAAVDLIERVGDERGIVGLMMITAGAEPPFGNRKYEPIYAAAEAEGLPVIFHTGGSGLDEFHIKGYEKFIETHTLGFLLGNMAQMTSLVVQGVPVKFPDLDIVFLESGLFYVPLLMARLDTEYRKRPSEAPLLENPPSEYMTDFYYGTQPLEEPAHMDDLDRVIERVGGPEQVMYASDFPHWDFDPPSTIIDLPFLSEHETQRILAGTAEEVFGI